MGTIEAQVPDQLEHEIARLVETGDFTSEAEALESLISTGLTAHKANARHDDDPDPDYAVDDPVGHHNEDEYAF
ncbi:DUF7120 family protein [Salinibaculum rarum]|uniref:DUF7120 family protein n=1 Tax=Salinibaculum rarum TaxID=3058903 RepID=UPI00265DE33D|nr:cell surface protein [Salinibaculum sp. KK48]